MKIIDLRCHVTNMGGSWLTETLIANPLSMYPEYRERRSSWYGTMRAAVMELVLENGVSGLGFVGGGRGEAVRQIVNDQFRQLVVGKSIFQSELIQDQLYRASMFFGRGGLVQCAISGIDIAVWDAKGKILSQPAFNLLGGKTRDRLKVYYTGNDPQALREFGICDMKIAVPFGPADGEEGMRRNEEAVARARELLGPDAFLALDVYIAWNVNYTLRMYDRLRSYGIAWIEEPVLPDDYEGYAQIRRSVGTMVAGGEHEYTLEGFRRLIEGGCVDIVQPDIYRAGGLTALKKIASLAQVHKIKMICHGVGSPTYHFLITNGPELTPYVEFLDIRRGGGKDWVLSNDLQPENGWLRLNENPGFGYELNRDVFMDQKRSVNPIW